jgi:hypothetical protein
MAVGSCCAMGSNLAGAVADTRELNVADHGRKYLSWLRPPIWRLQEDLQLKTLASELSYEMFTAECYIAPAVVKIVSGFDASSDLYRKAACISSRHRQKDDQAGESQHDHNGSQLIQASAVHRSLPRFSFAFSTSTVRHPCLTAAEITRRIVAHQRQYRSHARWPAQHSSGSARSG